MIYEYKKNFEVGYSNVDSTLRLGTVFASQYLQELATGIFVKMGVDYETMANKYHAGWILMRAKFKFHEMPHLGEEIAATVYPTKRAATYMRFEARFERPDKTLLFIAIMETCLIDIVNRSIFNVRQVEFPSDLECAEEISGLGFERMSEALDEASYAYEQKIYASDIDYNRHVNNIHYVRYMQNALPCSYWEEHTLREFEIKYLRECVEGQMLSVYQEESTAEDTAIVEDKASMEQGNSTRVLRFEIRESGQSIARAKMIIQ